MEHRLAEAEAVAPKTGAAAAAPKPSDRAVAAADPTGPR